MEYMVELKGESHYDFAVYSPAEVSADGVLYHDFVIQEPGELRESGTGVCIEVLDFDGIPLDEAEIKNAPFGDIPWQRGYPQTKTDSNGIVWLPWVKVGDHLLFIVKDKRIGGVNIQEFVVEEDEIVVRLDPMHGPQSESMSGDR